MYTDFFGLTEKPFSISPDPRYLYMSQRHADALAHLIYGISESGGFIQLTGEVGTGKTTLIRSLLEQLPDRTEIALILNPQLSRREFLLSICQELHVDIRVDASVKGLVDALNEKLLAAHAADRRVVLIVDEAQTLSPELLEQVRLLTNLETSKRKLLQIILIGQPELRELLAQPDMRQVAQRITGRYHLEPLSAADSAVYIRHRMRVAGAHAEIFTKQAIRKLYRLSGGVPRLINVIADRALLAGYTREQHTIGATLVRESAREVFGRSARPRLLPWISAAGACAALALFGSTLQEALLPNAPAEGAIEVAADPTLLGAAPDSRTLPPPTSIDPVVDAVEETKPARLSELLAANAARVSATPTLFELWNADFDAGSNRDACAQAADQGLRCLWSVGSALGELRQLNLPAVLILTAEDGSVHQAVLATLGYDYAELIVGGSTHRIGLAELSHHWYGDSLLLWRPPANDVSTLSPGARSERVRWLRESLARIRGESAPSTDSTLYDEQLADWVRDYQASRRLGVDGIVGVRTQIAIQSDLGLSGIPLLVGEL